MNSVYYIPKLNEIVLMVGTGVEDDVLHITLKGNLEFKEEIEKLTYGDMVYLGDL